jgi:hypothetical protein
LQAFFWIADMRLRIPERVYAFGLHLMFSACVAALCSILVFFVWYPGLLAFASGVSDIFVLLLLVDVILGPVITLIIFNREKKELTRDLVIVVVIQMVAMFYGLYAVFVARPVYIAFTLERFDIVYANDISSQNLTKAIRPEFHSLPFFGPKLIAAPLPDDLKVREEIIMEAVAGSGDDVQQMPQYYVPYSEHKVQVIKNLKSLQALKLFNKDSMQAVDDLIHKYAEIKADVGCILVKGKVNDLAAIINRSSGEVLEMTDLKL